jgi:AraC-like DNA-binding protein
MFVQHQYWSVDFGVERLPPRAAQARHRHLEGYASVVLSGTFLEASFTGLNRVEPGDVLLHGRFDCHANIPLNARPIRLLRLPWRYDSLEGRFHVNDPDMLAHLVQRDPREAMSVLAGQIRPCRPAPSDWTDLLAADLSADGRVILRDWAERIGIRPDALSRGFQARFGISPKAFRLEARTRRAWRAVIETGHSLTNIAHEHGFFDLAHMSRSIRAFTGKWPSEWRMGLKAPKSVQAVAPII